MPSSGCSSTSSRCGTIGFLALLLFFVVVGGAVHVVRACKKEQ